MCKASPFSRHFPEPHLTAVGYDTKKVATNLICYQAMRQAVTDLYKDQIIREAGLTV